MGAWQPAGYRFGSSAPMSALDRWQCGNDQSPPCKSRTRAGHRNPTPRGNVMQRVDVRLEDDLTGGPADETVEFGIDGRAYEIDLSARHARGVSPAGRALP